MSSALKAFRAQRAEAEQIRTRLTQVVDLLRAIRSEANVLAHDETLRTLLQEEQTWLVRTKDLINEVRHVRESETRRFWPAVWRR
jgi:prophage antirepressor-like protein